MPKQKKLDVIILGHRLYKFELVDTVTLGNMKRQIKKYNIHQIQGL